MWSPKPVTENTYFRATVAYKYAFLAEMKHIFPSPLLKMPLATDATVGLFKHL